MKNLYTILTCGSASNEHRIIAVGPLTKQPCTVPYRVLLIETKENFIVYNENFGDDDLDVRVINKSHFESGSYFELDQLVKATEKFAERIQRNAQYFASLYREDAV